jgi:hypothetical protein
MDLTAFVDVAIGLSLLYLGASLFVTIINEYVAQAFRLRGRQLAKDLARLIDNPKLIESLRVSPALEPFFAADGKPGTYIDPKVFAHLLVGALRAGQTGAAKMDSIIAAIDALPDSDIKQQLSALAHSAPDKIDEFVASVSTWIDRTLSMMGEIYKQRMQLISFGIGLAVGVAFNLNTLAVMSHLYSDKAAREAAVAVAEQITARVDQPTFDACLQKTPEEMRDATECKPMAGLVDTVRQRNEMLGKLPIGWPVVTGLNRSPLPVWLWCALGWFLTALAISLGASFWFDLLNRLVNVRHGMRRPEVEEK